MVTPPAPTYATFFYGVFEIFLLERFGNNLLLYIILYKNVIAICRRYDEERGAEELWTFQETIQEWYELELTFQGTFLKLDFIDLRTGINKNMITNTLFEK